MADDAPEEEDLGATKVLDETEAPAVTFAEGENEKLGEGVEEEDVADENELQRLIEAVREGDQARACCCGGIPMPPMPPYMPPICCQGMPIPPMPPCIPGRDRRAAPGGGARRRRRTVARAR